MPEPSERRKKLEAALAADPSDSFLRYGLAMQCLKEGDLEEGRRVLKALIEDHPDDQIAAYQQLGQSHMDEGETEEAIRWFRLGVAKARAAGDEKAAGEMTGFLELLGASTGNDS